MRPLDDLFEKQALHPFGEKPSIVLARLELYNRKLPCDPKAVRKRCRDFLQPHATSVEKNNRTYTLPGG